MKNLVNPILVWLNGLFTATPNALRPYRWLILSFVVLVTGITGYGLTKFQMDMSIDSFFAADDPFMKGYDQFKKDFGSDESVFLVFEAKDGDYFSEKSIRLMHEMTSEIENWQNQTSLAFAEDSQLKRIVRVTSLTNSRYQLIRGDDLISAKMVSRDKLPQTPAELAEFKKLAQSQEHFGGFLYSKKDPAFGGLSIKTDFGMTLKEPINMAEEADISFEDDFSMDVDESLTVEEVDYADEDFMNFAAFMTDMRLIIEQDKYKDHFNVHALGNPALYEYSLGLMSEMGGLLFGLIFIIVVMLWSLLRSFAAVIWPILIISVVSVWLTGTTALLGMKESSMISITVMLIMTIGIAACVHVMSSYLIFRRNDLEHEEALTQSYRKTGGPILITCITTAGGMAAIGMTGLPFMIHFAIQLVIGIFLTWGFIWLVLPALMDLWHPLQGKKGSEVVKKMGPIGNFFSAMWLQPALDRIPAFVSRRPYAISFVFIMVFALFAYGATKVQIDSNMAEVADENSALSIAYDVVDEKMSGGQSLEVLVEFDETDSLKKMEVLAAMDRFERHLLVTYPEMAKRTFSIAKMIKDTNRVMHGNDEAYYRVPTDQTLTNQLLYLFDSANPEDRRALVNDNYSKTHITIQVNNAGSHEYSLFFANVQKDVKTLFADLQAKHPDMKISLAGGLPMFMQMAQDMSEAQMESFIRAIIFISCIMIITLGSIQGGLISILPNMIPAIATFGAMGLTGALLDADTLFIAPVIIGLAVDDTIHLIAHYRDNLLHGKDHDQAIAETLKEVGQAVTFTTLVLGLGFGILAFSSYGGMSKMGIYGSLGIFVALICDLYFLPALLHIFKPDMGTKGQSAPDDYHLQEGV